MFGLFFTTPIPNIYDNQPYAQSISFDQKYELTEGIYVKNSEFSIIGTATNSITSKAYISLVQNGIIIKTVELINGSYDLGSVYDGIYDVILHKTASGSLVPQLPDGFSAFTGERFGSGPFDAVADGKFTIQVLGDYIGGAKRKAVESIIFELVAAPLPINLLSFAAKQVAKLVNIGWHTSSETNFSHFELQTSNNGKEFSTSGEVKGNQSSIYNFTDSNPTEGVKYYKLKMVDLNGTYSLSKTISVNFEKNGSYLSVENPAQNGVILARSNYLNPSFTLLNSLGQKMLISISELPNNQHKISAKSINSGIYFLMVECEGKCETTKIVFE